MNREHINRLENSDYYILFSNLLVILAIIFLDFNLLNVLLIFLLETVIIFAFALIKRIGKDKFGYFLSIILFLLFFFSYSVIFVIIGLFIISIFGNQTGFETSELVLNSNNFLLPVIAIFLSYTYSYFTEYKSAQKLKKVTTKRELKEHLLGMEAKEIECPEFVRDIFWERILIIILVILSGLFINYFGVVSIIAPLTLVGIKTFFDLRMSFKKRSHTIKNNVALPV